MIARPGSEDSAIKYFLVNFVTFKMIACLGFATRRIGFTPLRRHSFGSGLFAIQKVRIVVFSATFKMYNCCPLISGAGIAQKESADAWLGRRSNSSNWLPFRVSSEARI